MAEVVRGARLLMIAILIAIGCAPPRDEVHVTNPNSTEGSESVALHLPGTTVLVRTVNAAIKRSDVTEILQIGASLTVSSDDGRVLRVKSIEGSGVIEHDAVVSLDQAIPLFSEQIRQFPNDPWLYSARGVAYRHAGRNDLALADYDKGLELDPRCAELYLRRGYVHRLLSDLPRAIADQTQAIVISPDSVQAWINRGWAHFLNGDVEQARRDYKHAVALAPSAARTHSAFADFLVRSGNFTEGLIECDAALRIDSAYVPALISRASAKAGLGDVESAAQTLVSASLIKPDTLKKEYWRFVEWLNSEELKASANDEVVLLRAYRSYVQGDPGKSREELGRIGPHSKVAALGQLLGGTIEAHLGDNEAAIVSLTAAADAGIVSDELFGLRGSVYRALGNHKLAVADFTMALRLNPALPGVWRDRASSNLSLGQVDIAEQDASLSILVAPDSEWSRLVRAEIRLAKGDANGAFADATSGCERASGNGELQMLRVTAWLRTKGRNVKDFKAAVVQTKEEPESMRKLRHARSLVERSSEYKEMLKGRDKLLSLTVKEMMPFCPPPVDVHSIRGRELREWYRGKCMGLARDPDFGFEVEAAFLAVNALIRFEEFCDTQLMTLLMGCFSPAEQASLREDRAVADALCFPLHDLSLDRNKETLQIADALISEALPTVEDNSPLLTMRGDVRLALGRFEEAVEDYSAAIQHEPNLTSAFIGRAWAKLSMGDLEAARADIVEVPVSAFEPRQDPAVRAEVKRLIHQALQNNLAADLEIIAAVLDVPLVIDLDKYFLTVVGRINAAIGRRRLAALSFKGTALVDLIRARDLMRESEFTNASGLSILIDVCQSVMHGANQNTP